VGRMRRGAVEWMALFLCFRCGAVRCRAGERRHNWFSSSYGLVAWTLECFARWIGRMFGDGGVGGEDTTRDEQHVIRGPCVSRISTPSNLNIGIT
jgi:hypothetical protein